MSSSPAFATPAPVISVVPRTTVSPLRKPPSAVLDNPPPVPTVAPTSTPGDQSSWFPSSWRSREARQQPEYPDLSHLRSVEERLSRLPSLVAPGEIYSLKEKLAQVCLGNGFLLQGGDCAEDLNETANGVKDTLRCLFKMAVILMWGSQQPVVKIGRMAGQYAKPRSSPTETKDGLTLPTYRGEVSLFIILCILHPVLFFYYYQSRRFFRSPLILIFSSILTFPPIFSHCRTSMDQSSLLKPEFLILKG